MSYFTALFDANVLYPAPLRDIVLQMGVEGLYRAKWSADIHREWIEALLRNEPHRDRAVLERTRDLMNEAVPDALVTGYETLIPVLELPDADDRHVLAAVITGHCDVIVTQNLQHFPPLILEFYGVEAQHPDDFLSNQLNLAPGTFCVGIRKIRSRLKKPTYSVEDYLNILIRQGLVATASELNQFSQLL